MPMACYKCYEDPCVVSFLLRSMHNQEATRVFFWVVGMTYSYSYSFSVFSEIIEAETKTEHKWLVKAAKRLWGHKDGPPVTSWPSSANELLHSVSFDEVYELMPKWKPGKSGRGILAYSDDGCSMFAVAPLVQLYLKKFHKDWYWYTEWAEITEKPTPGDFRGGAVFITDQHVAWHMTTHWVNGMIERLHLQRG